MNAMPRSITRTMPNPSRTFARIENRGGLEVMLACTANGRLDGERRHRHQMLPAPPHRPISLNLRRTTINFPTAPGALAEGDSGGKFGLGNRASGLQFSPLVC